MGNTFYLSSKFLMVVDSAHFSYFGKQRWNNVNKTSYDWLYVVVLFDGTLLKEFFCKSGLFLPGMVTHD